MSKHEFLLLTILQFQNICINFFKLILSLLSKYEKIYQTSIIFTFKTNAIVCTSSHLYFLKNHNLFFSKPSIFQTWKPDKIYLNIKNEIEL